MIDAYVNVVADAGAVSAAATEIADIDQVHTVHVVTGEYDIVAQIELDDPNELPNVVADDIHAITGVVDTVTNVAFAP